MGNESESGHLLGKNDSGVELKFKGRLNIMTVLRARAFFKVMRLNRTVRSRMAPIWGRMIGFLWPPLFFSSPVGGKTYEEQ